MKINTLVYSSIQFNTFNSKLPKSDDSMFLKRTAKFSFILIAFLGFARESQALTVKTWAGAATGGAWSTASNWNPAAIPASTDSIVFNTPSANMNITGIPTVTIGSMTINNTFGTNNGTKFTVTLATAGVTLTMTHIWVEGSLFNPSGLICNPSITITGAQGLSYGFYSITNSSSLELASGCTFTIPLLASAYFWQNTGTTFTSDLGSIVNINGGAELLGTVNLNGTTTVATGANVAVGGGENSGALAINGSGNIFVSNGSFSNTGTITLTGTSATVAAIFEVYSGGTFTQSGAGAVNAGNFSSVVFYPSGFGSITTTIPSGITINGTGSKFILEVPSSANCAVTFTAPGPSIAAADTMIIEGNTSSGTITSVTGSPVYNINSVLEYLSVASQTVALTVSGEWPISGTIPKVRINSPIGPGVTLNSARSLTNAAVDTAFSLQNGVFTVGAGLLSVPTGPTINIARSAGSITASPTWSSSVNVAYVGGTTPITTGPELPDPVTNGGAYATVLNNLILNKTSGNIVNLGGNVQVNGTGTTSGLVQTSGTLNIGPNTLSIAGNINQASASMSLAGMTTSVLNITGSVPGFIGTVYFTQGTNLGTLNFTNSNGAGSWIQLPTNPGGSPTPTINNQLILGGGIIYVTNSLAIIGYKGTAANLASGSANGYIAFASASSSFPMVGGFELLNGATQTLTSGPYILPIGLGNLTVPASGTVVGVGTPAVTGWRPATVTFNATPAANQNVLFSIIGDTCAVTNNLDGESPYWEGVPANTNKRSGIIYGIYSTSTPPLLSLANLSLTYQNSDFSGGTPAIGNVDLFSYNQAKVSWIGQLQNSNSTSGSLNTITINNYSSQPINSSAFEGEFTLGVPGGILNTQNIYTWTDNDFNGQWDDANNWVNQGGQVTGWPGQDTTDVALINTAGNVGGDWPTILSSTGSGVVPLDHIIISGSGSVLNLAAGSHLTLYQDTISAIGASSTTPIMLSGGATVNADPASTIEYGVPGSLLQLSSNTYQGISTGFTYGNLTLSAYPNSTESATKTLQFGNNIVVAGNLTVNGEVTLNIGPASGSGSPSSILVHGNWSQESFISGQFITYSFNPSYTGYTPSQIIMDGANANSTISQTVLGALGSSTMYPYITGPVTVNSNNLTLVITGITNTGILKIAANDTVAISNLYPSSGLIESVSGNSGVVKLTSNVSFPDGANFTAPAHYGSGCSVGNNFAGGNMISLINSGSLGDSIDASISVINFSNGYIATQTSTRTYISPSNVVLSVLGSYQNWGSANSSGVFGPGTLQLLGNVSIPSGTSSAGTPAGYFGSTAATALSVVIGDGITYFPTDSLTARDTVGNITINTGSTLLMRNTAIGMTILGNFIENGIFTTNATNNTITFGGSATQNVTTASGFNFPNLTVNNTGTVPINFVTLLSNITVNGNITLTKGNINTYSHNYRVIMPSTGTGTVTASTSTGWVFGSLEKYISASTAKTFEVGDSTVFYNAVPTSATLTSITTPGDLIFTYHPYEHPQISTSGINPDTCVAKYWTVTNSSTVPISFASASLVLGWPTTDELPNSSVSTTGWVTKLYNGSAWSTPTSALDGSQAVTVSSLTSFGDFAVGRSGCTGSSTPTVSISPTSPSSCVGSTIAFTGTATGGSLAYQWSKNNVPIVGATSSAYTTPTLAAGDNGNVYAVTVTNCSGSSSTSTTASVGIPPSAFTVSPTASTVSICAHNGATVTLTENGGTLPAGAYWQWYNDLNQFLSADAVGGHLTSTNASLTVTPTTSAAAGNSYYSLQMQNISAGSCPTTLNGTNTTTIIIDSADVAPTSLNGATSICSGSSVTLSETGGYVSGSVGAAGKWEWFTNSSYSGSPVSSGLSTTGSYSPSPTTTTTYYLEGYYTTTGVIGCPIVQGTQSGGASTGVTVTVLQPSTAATSISASLTSLCNNGTSTTLTQSGGSLGTGANWHWYTDPAYTQSVGTSSAANASYSVTPTITTTYYVRIENETSPCTATIAGPAGGVTVFVNQLSANPTGASAGSGTICNGQSTTLTLSGGGGGTGEVVKWYTGSCGGTLVATGNGASVNPTATTTYYGRYEDGAPCNYQTTCQTITVIVNQKSADPVSAAVGSGTICPGSSTTLTLSGGGGGTGEVVKWYTGSCGGTLVATGNGASVSPPLGATTYYGRYEDGGPCNYTSACQSVIVTAVDNQAPIPNVASLPTVTGECSATVSSTPTATDNCVGTVTGTTSNPLTYNTQGTFTINWSYTDGNGNTSTQTQTVIVHDDQAPVPNVASLATITGECSATVSSTPTATDNCAGSVIGTTSNPLTYNTQGTFTINWSYSDGNGNTSTQTQTVIVHDDQAPVPNVSNLPDLTSDCAITAVPPTATDNCVGSVTGTTSNPLTYTVPGNYVITWSYTDGNGNTSTQTQNVFLSKDVTDPYITCPGAQSKVTDAGFCTYTVQGTEFDPASYGDNCSGATISNSYNNSSTLAGAVFNAGIVGITWTVTDASGNTASCGFGVTVNDTTPPSITCVDDTTVSTDVNNCYYTIVGTQYDPTFSDNCSGAFIINDYNYENTLAGAIFDQGSTTVDWFAIDASDNQSICSFTITVNDNIPPTISCVGPQTRSTDEGECTYTTEGTEFDPTAVGDNCTYNDPTNNLNGGTTLEGWAFSVGTTNVIWTVTDGSGNTNSCSFTVSVTDNEAPVISCLDDQYVMADATCGYTVVGTQFDPSFTDNSAACGGVTTITNDWTNTNTLSGGRPFPDGATLVTWVATDSSGNTDTCRFNIVVVDNTPPTIQCVNDTTVNTDPGSCTYAVVGTEFDPASYNDNCSVASITNSYNNSYTLADTIFYQGNTLVTWTATDESGNTSTCSFTVSVVNNQPPTIQCVSDQYRNTDPASCDYVAVGTEFDPTVTFNCSAVTLTNNYNGGSTLAGADFDQTTTLVTWYATDANGLIDSCSFNVIVTDNENPTIQCVNDTTLHTDPGVCTYTVSGTQFDPIVSDNCTIASDTNNYTHTNTLEGAVFNKGSVLVTWVVTDGSGNTNSCSYTITVTDNEKPTISCVGAQSRNTDPGSCSYAVEGTEFDPTATGDNCTVASVTNNYNNQSTLADTSFGQGSTVVVWTVTDGSGNTNTCSFTVTVTDNQAPNITCADDTSVSTDPGSCTYTVVGTLYDPSYSDNCSATITNDYSHSNTLAGAIFGQSTTYVTWTATDGSGNTNTCVFAITVTDNQAPSITCVGNQSVSTDPGSCDFTVVGTEFDPASYSDNCTLVTLSNNYNSSNTLEGAIFNQGTTNVTWYATDGSGNIDSCSFTVTVTDHENPVVECVGDQSRSTNLNECTYTADTTEFDPLSTYDNCTVASVTNSYNGLSTLAGAVFNKGEVLVTWTVTDENGNTGTCSFNVIVTDNQPPSITCVGNQTRTPNPGGCSYTADTTEFDPTSYSDNCPGTTISNSYNGGSTLAGAVFSGTTLVTWYATDASGNVDSCSFTVTVPTPPAPSVTVVNNCGSSTLSTTALGSLLWSTGATTSSITVTAAGTYSVTTTVTGCTSAPGTGTAAPLIVPSAPVVTVVNSCGFSTLSTNAGGSLLWSTGATTPSITVSIAGTYSVTTTAGDGCTSPYGTGVAAPLIIPGSPVVNVVNNCNETSLLYTTAPGSLHWNTGATTSAITVAAAGSYTVTTTAGDGCSASGIGVAAPKNTPSTPIVLDVNNCGSSTLTAINTTGALLWNTGATTSTITVTSGGTYTVNQTINGCTSLNGSALAAPKVIPSPPVVTDVDGCGSSTLSTTAAGTLHWSTGSSNTFITVTVAGTYSVTTTVNGCISGAGTGAASPKSTPSAPSVTVVNSCGSSTLSTTASGSLLWNTGATTASIAVSASGIYAVTTTVNGCTSLSGSGSASPKALPGTPVVTVVNNCNGTSVLTTSAVGSLNWSTGATTSSITVSAAGTYSVTLSSGGCTGIAGTGTAAPGSTPPTPVVSVVNNCGGSTLSTTAGGSLLWSTGATSSSINVALAGTYSVNTTVNGCISASGTGIAAPIAGVSGYSDLDPDGTTIACLNSGPYSFYIDNIGTGATSYVWTIPAGFTAASLVTTVPNISITATGTAQTGIVTVTPQNGCGVGATLSDSIRVNVVPTPVVTVSNNCGNSVLSTTATGSLLWNTGATTISVTVTSAGTYSVTSTVNGCTSLAGTATAAPNPVPATPVVLVSNNCGNSVLSTTSAGTLHWGTGATASAITVTMAGSYCVTTTVNGCTSLMGTGVAAPNATPSAPVVTIADNCGSATLSTTASGSLLWSPGGATTSSITVTSAGTYSVTQTVNECISSSGKGTAAPKAVPATPVVTVANSCGSSTLSTTSTGTLLWNTGSKNEFIEVSTSGTYSVTTTVNGCTSKAGTGLAAPKAIPATPVITVVNNCHNSVLSTSASGSLVWSKGAATTSSITVTAEGTYNVTTTVNGCTSVAGTATADPMTAPGTPGAITGNASACKNTGPFTYSIAPVSGATFYTWTIPTGSTAPSLTTTVPNIAVTFGHSAATGNITVTAGNPCGNSTGAASKKITINCREADQDPQADAPAVANMMVYPNPANDLVTVRFNSPSAAQYHMSLVDITGRMIIVKEGAFAEGDNYIQLDLGGLAKGVYLLNLQSDNYNGVVRTVLQ